MKLTALHLCYNFTAWEQLFTCATTWLHETDSSSPVLHLDCMELTALHLCYNMTAWNWQLFTCATTWLHETDSSSHVLQLNCLELTALHLSFSMQLTTGKLSQETGDIRSFLLILKSHHYTDHYVTFRLVHFCTSEEWKELKKSLEVILRQPGDQPTNPR